MMQSLGARLFSRSSLVTGTAIRSISTSRPVRSEGLYVHRDSPDNNPNTEFKWTEPNLARAKAIMDNYPSGHKKGAMIPLLDLAQRQYGWLPLSAMDAVAKLIETPKMRVYEVATFYTMFRREPTGKYHIQVCTTTPCMLRGSGDIVKACEESLGIKIGHSTKDMQFTLSEVECAGACANAPVMAVNDDYLEDLSPEATKQILADLKANKEIKIGPVNSRKASEPISGLTTLTEAPKGPGYGVRSDL